MTIIDPMKTSQEVDELAKWAWKRKWARRIPVAMLMDPDLPSRSGVIADFFIRALLIERARTRKLKKQLKLTEVKRDIYAKGEAEMAEAAMDSSKNLRRAERRGMKLAADIVRELCGKEGDDMTPHQVDLMIGKLRNMASDFAERR